MQYLHEMTKKLCLWLPMALLALTTAYSQKPSEGVIQGLVTQARSQAYAEVVEFRKRNGYMNGDVYVA